MSAPGTMPISEITPTGHLTKGTRVQVTEMNLKITEKQGRPAKGSIMTEAINQREDR